MKRIELFILYILFLTVPAMAQTYEAEYLIGNFIRAEKVDADGRHWVKKIPNGTTIEVKNRIVGQDTASCRNVLAEFEFEGERYTTEARWLKYSKDNDKSQMDIFAEDDFSPRFHILRNLSFTDMPPLSSKGKFMYGLTLPILMFLLMIIAVFTLLRSSKSLSIIPFVLAIAIQIYSICMLGEDSWWWCDPNYQTIGGSIFGLIPLAIYIALVFSYVILAWTFSKTEAKLWPVLVCILAIFPLAMVSKLAFDSIWSGCVFALALPFIINGIKGGASGIIDTIILTLGVIELLLVVSAGLLISGRLLATIVIACPIFAVPIIMIISKFKAGHIKGGISRMPDGTFKTTSGGIYHSYEDAERNA